MNGRVLIIAGSDSGGGAGIQADIKSVGALGGFAMTAVTALTAQNTLGVHDVHPVDTGFIAKQIMVVLDDLGADCLKTGMLHSVEVIEVVADMISRHAAELPLVADPVMIAKGGASLLDQSAYTALVERIVPLATVLTPNAPEAAAMTGIQVVDVESQRAAGEALRAMGAHAVLVKGGHIDGPQIVDLLVTDEGPVHFESPRIDTIHTHGTGCTLASAIAAGLAQKMDLPSAVSRARNYVMAAIAGAPGFGAGHGPIDHTITVDVGRIVT